MLASVWFPIAVEIGPDAVVEIPIAVALSPLAVVPDPIATEDAPVADVLLLLSSICAFMLNERVKAKSVSIFFISNYFTIRY